MKSENTITLDKAQIDLSYYIRYLIDFEEKDLCRLCDFGFVNGTKIKPVFNSMFSGATAYLIKGSVISLRTEDAKNIIVSSWR